MREKSLREIERERERKITERKREMGREGERYC